MKVSNHANLRQDAGLAYSYLPQLQNILAYKVRYSAPKSAGLELNLIIRPDEMERYRQLQSYGLSEYRNHPECFDPSPCLNSSLSLDPLAIRVAQLFELS